MALVELFRTTGERRYLELAARMVEARGARPARRGPVRFGLLAGSRRRSATRRPSPATPSASSTSIAARSTSPPSSAIAQLLDAVMRRWHDMVATRMYLTGGLGSRHLDEAFGDPFELPPDRAYAETCAAIASVMLAWRLLLATGDPDCADVIERTVYNGVLPGRVARRHALLLRQHAAAPDRPGAGGRRRTASARRGSRAPAARRT